MITLIGGPVAGTYMVKRAPVYLRAVVGAAGQGKDVLNELDDSPGPDEKVFVYKLEGEALPVHLLMSPRRLSGFYMMGKYNYLPDVDGELLRETDAWRRWVIEHSPGRSVDPETGVSIDVQCPVDKQACDQALKACCSCPRGNKSN